MKRWVAVLALIALSSTAAAAPKKKKKKPETEQTVKEPVKEAPPPAPVQPVEVKTGPTKEELEKQQREEEQRRVEAAKKKLEAEARKSSKITPGTASRWSNRGAMQPIAAEVPITVPLPERAIPIAPGAETPGQSLIGDEELLQFRLFVSANHQETKGQEVIYLPDQIAGDGAVATVKRAPYDNDIDLFRGRATMSYEHIANSDIGLRLDLEYRGRSSGARRTDHRINELYISYGLTDFKSNDSMNFGISFGRVAVREAGYAQTDGALLRIKLSDSFKLGAFGGVTGNPYGYNWAARQTQEISTDWLRAGAFAAFREGRFFGSAAAVATLNRLAGQVLPGKPGAPSAGGLDRLYLFLDTAFLATPEINIFVTGWLDFIGSDLVQNAEAVLAWAPTRDLDLRFGLGRFSTVVYEVSTPYSFEIDPASNKAGVNNLVIVDENGNPIVPFDSVLGTVAYTTARARGGYRVIPTVELFAATELMLRDAGAINKQTLASDGAQIRFAPLRLLPAAGVRFADPEILDASLQFTYILDDQSNADAAIQGAIGRELFGFYGQVDARTYFGKIAGSDGGVELSYTLPRDLTPGRFMLRTMLRYYRENVRLGRPTDLTTGIVADENALYYLPVQESWLGFASAEWRF